MTFGSYADSLSKKDLNLQINGIKINRFKTFKYLGATIDYNLKWESHIKNILRNLGYFLFLLYKLNHIDKKLNMSCIMPSTTVSGPIE